MSSCGCLSATALHCTALRVHIIYARVVGYRCCVSYGASNKACLKRIIRYLFEVGVGRAGGVVCVSRFVYDDAQRLKTVRHAVPYVCSAELQIDISIRNSREVRACRAARKVRVTMRLRCAHQCDAVMNIISPHRCACDVCECVAHQ